MSGARYVINSTDRNLTYAFFAPLVAILWKQRIHYSPVTLFVGSRADWTSQEAFRLVYESTARYSEIVHITQIPQFKTSTLAQISRLFAAAIDFPLGSTLLTSDMDMLPLSAEYFEGSGLLETFRIRGADAYRPEFRFPICYLSASLGVWREVMNIQRLDINRCLGVNLDPKRDEWNYDEEYFAERLGRWEGFPARCEFMARGWQEGVALGRLDRCRWSFSGRLDGFIDSHSLRPGYLAHWAEIEKVLQAALGAQNFEWVRNYRRQFLSLVDPRAYQAEANTNDYLGAS